LFSGQCTNSCTLENGDLMLGNRTQTTANHGLAWRIPAPAKEPDATRVIAKLTNSVIDPQKSLSRNLSDTAK
jgi:hypothetical protein